MIKFLMAISFINRVDCAIKVIEQELLESNEVFNTKCLLKTLYGELPYQLYFRPSLVQKNEALQCVKRLSAKRASSVILKEAIKY